MRRYALTTAGALATIAGPLPLREPTATPAGAHGPVIYDARLAVVGAPGGPALEVRVTLRGAGRHTLTWTSARGNCNPPLYLRPIATPRGATREVAWSDVAWQADAARRASEGRIGFSCSGVQLRVRLAPGRRVRLPPRRYAVSAVRGDSLPAGWYAAAVGVVVYEANATGAGRVDTLRVPAGHVRLP